MVSSLGSTVVVLISSTEMSSPFFNHDSGSMVVSGSSVVVNESRSLSVTVVEETVVVLRLSSSKPRLDIDISLAI